MENVFMGIGIILLILGAWVADREAKRIKENLTSQQGKKHA